MAKTYSSEYGSAFPNSVLTLHGYKDVDTTVGELIKQYYDFMDSGNIASASALVESNWDILKPYYVGMDCLNGLEEELYNAEIFALTRQETVISAGEPELEGYATGSYWLKPII